MGTHIHHFDKSLIIKKELTEELNIISTDTIENGPKIKSITLEDRVLNFYEGTYTDEYVSNLSKGQDIEVISLRSYVPEGFSTSGKNKDQWNRNFIIPWKSDSYAIRMPDKLGTLTNDNGCAGAQFFNHNLKITTNNKVEIIYFPRKISSKRTFYYIPFMAHGDAGGFSESVFDFYIKVTRFKRIEDFNKQLDNYISENPIGHQSNGFNELNTVGLEYDFPHFDRELQIMYYERMDIFDMDDGKLVASL